MAEALDVLFESFKFIENKAEHDEQNTRSRSAAGASRLGRARHQRELYKVTPPSP